MATASVVAWMGAKNSGHYAAAKWGVIGLVRSLALEVAADGITVNAVLPAGVNTDFIHNQAMYQVLRAGPGQPIRQTSCRCSRRRPGCWSRRTAAQDISRAILFLVSDDGGYLNGETLTLSRGLSASNAT